MVVILKAVYVVINGQDEGSGIISKISVFLIFQDNTMLGSNLDLISNPTP